MDRIGEIALAIAEGTIGGWLNDGRYVQFYDGKLSLLTREGVIIASRPFSCRGDAVNGLRLFLESI